MRSMLAKPASIAPMHAAAVAYGMKLHVVCVCVRGGGGGGVLCVRAHAHKSITRYLGWSPAHLQYVTMSLLGLCSGSEKKTYHDGEVANAGGGAC